MSPRSRTLLFGTIAFVIACVCAVVAADLSLLLGKDILLSLEKQAALHPGSPAPDFSLRTRDGPEVRLSQYRGQPVLLTFAASWCPACRQEAPYQQTLHTQHPELVVLLIDSNEEDEVVQGFASDFGMTFPILLDSSGMLSLKYRIFSIPTSFFIDPSGTIRYVYIGGLGPWLMTDTLPLIGVEP